MRVNRWKKSIALLLAMVMVCAMALAGCSGKNGETDGTDANAEPYSKDIFAMDTYMTVSAYGEQGEKAVDSAVKEINRLDALLSTGKDTSEVSALNKNEGGDLSADTNALMDAALDLYESTDHVFDITIYKGYTSATVAQLYRDLGVTSGLINLGGNVQTVGLKPDGSEWRIGIQHPEDENAMLGVVTTHDEAVITSGGYERNFEEDGVVYHHIIDPSTGYPADSGLISVTIVSEDGTLADGLSTSLFIMGREKATEYWKSHQKDFDFILCEEDGTLVVSSGLKDRFTPADDNAKVEYVS